MWRMAANRARLSGDGLDSEHDARLRIKAVQQQLLVRVP